MVRIGVDVARGACGRWCHPGRFHRARPDLSPADVASCAISWWPRC
ncbi:ATP-dependent DNA ligase [Streptomyces sp. NPDC051315]